MDANTQVNLMLNALNKSKMKLVPMYKHEFEMLRRLAPILPEKIGRNVQGDPKIIYVDKEKTIETLKNLYNFKTKTEATKEVQKSTVAFKK